MLHQDAFKKWQKKNNFFNQVMWECWWVNKPALLVLRLWQPLLLCCLSLGILSPVISLSLSFAPVLSYTREQLGPEWAPNYVRVQPKTLPDSLSAWQTIICTHSDADCSVWQAIKSLWHLCSSSVIILQWIIFQSFPSTVQSQWAVKSDIKTHT